MSATRQELEQQLEDHFVSYGWPAKRSPDGTVRAPGLGGVVWIGLPVTRGDLADAGFEQRLLDLASERMPGGELCPLELLPAPDCADGLRALLDRLRLRQRGHVEVYSLAA